MGAGLIQALHHCHRPSVTASPRELVSVALPHQNGVGPILKPSPSRDQLLLPLRKAGGRRGGLRALPGGPWGFRGLGQVGEPAGQLPTPCHTVESGLSRLTHSGNTWPLWMLQSSCKRGRNGPEFSATLPGARWLCRVGMGVGGAPPLGSLHPTLASMNLGFQAGEVVCRDQVVCLCLHTYGLIFSENG